MREQALKLGLVATAGCARLGQVARRDVTATDFTARLDVFMDQLAGVRPRCEGTSPTLL
jgi:hypothetical protein